MPTFVICAHRPSRVAMYTRTRDLHPSASIGQEIQLRQFLLSHPDWSPVADYHDYGSNARHTGPALRQAVADARTGQFDVLLVARLDVLGRTVGPLAAVLADLDRAGVAVRTADGAVDTTHPADRALLAMLTVVAGFEAAHDADIDAFARARRRHRRSRWTVCRRPSERG